MKILKVCAWKIHFCILNQYRLFYFHESTHVIDAQSQWCTKNRLDKCNAQFRRIMDSPKKTA